MSHTGISGTALENGDFIVIPPGSAGWLRSLVLDPLESALKNVETVFVVPDDSLWHVPLGALPAPDGGYTGESRHFVYLNAPRDVLRFSVEAAPAARSIVIADPDYDGPIRDTRVEIADRLERLSGTRDEGTLVGRSLDAAVWMDGDASKVRLQAHASPRILHIASHGWFEGDAVMRHEKHMAESNPLLRSALALAGANQAFASQNATRDGLLSAQDVLSLDLRGTELVVLSACETGMGTARASEGTLGLRWAFAAAGAHAQVVSLWKVADEATCELMIAFYKHLLRGASKVAALRSAQQELRQTYGEPRHWAAFVCYGNPRPIHPAPS